MSELNFKLPESQTIQEYVGFQMDVLNELAKRLGITADECAAQYYEQYSAYVRGNEEILDSSRQDRAGTIDKVVQYLLENSQVGHAA